MEKGLQTKEKIIYKIKNKREKKIVIKKYSRNKKETNLLSADSYLFFNKSKYQKRCAEKLEKKIYNISPNIIINKNSKAKIRIKIRNILLFIIFSFIYLFNQILGEKINFIEIYKQFKK